ncbi:MAG: hypothetical protein IPM78_11765 [Moraxellaceae bacterium]|nr:hypothetical protein [Moraxellaceae bacterium]
MVFDDLHIIKLSDGTYSGGDEAFFPNVENQQDTFFPRVDWLLYNSGRSKIQQEEAKHFLAEMGVKEVGVSTG